MKDLSMLKEEIARALCELNGYNLDYTEDAQAALDIIQPHWDELQAENERLREPFTRMTSSFDKMCEVASDLRNKSDEQQAKIENASQLLAWHEGSPEFKGYKHPSQRVQSNEIHSMVCEDD